MTIQHRKDNLRISEAAPYPWPDFQADEWSVTKPLKIKGVPFKLEDSSFGDDFLQVSRRDEIADLVVLADSYSAHFLTDHLNEALAQVIPVIGIQQGNARGNDRLQARADLLIPALSPNCLARLLYQLEPMVARLRRVLPILSQNATPENILLARLFVRDRGLVPRRDPTSRNMAEYEDSCVFPNLLGLAEQLAKAGRLERRFYDALSTCPRCESARVYTRPWPAIAETPDQPCQSEPPTNSICLDCSHEMPPSEIIGRPVYAYGLTEIFELFSGAPREVPI